VCALLWGGVLKISHHIVEDRRLVGADNAYYSSFCFQGPPGCELNTMYLFTLGDSLIYILVAEDNHNACAFYPFIYARLIIPQGPATVSQGNSFTNTSLGNKRLVDVDLGPFKPYSSHPFHTSALQHASYLTFLCRLGSISNVLYVMFSFLSSRV